MLKTQSLFFEGIMAELEQLVERIVQKILIPPKRPLKSLRSSIKKKRETNGEPKIKKKFLGNRDIAENNTLLEEPVKTLIQMLFSEVSMHETMKEFKIDETLLPIGMISSSNIGAAHHYLLKIAVLLLKDVDPISNELIGLSNQFYSQIPHKDEPLTINSLKAYKDKLKLLKELKQIELCFKMSNKGQNSLVENYYSLQTKITCFKPESSSFKMIEKYA